MVWASQAAKITLNLIPPWGTIDDVSQRPIDLEAAPAHFGKAIKRENERVEQHIEVGEGSHRGHHWPDGGARSRANEWRY